LIAKLAAVGHPCNGVQPDQGAQLGPKPISSTDCSVGNDPLTIDTCNALDMPSVVKLPTADRAAICAAGHGFGITTRYDVTGANSSIQIPNATTSARSPTDLQTIVAKALGGTPQTIRY
jgi:hypothetical protein